MFCDLARVYIVVRGWSSPRYSPIVATAYAYPGYSPYCRYRVKLRLRNPGYSPSLTCTTAYIPPSRSRLYIVYTCYIGTRDVLTAHASPLGCQIRDDGFYVADENPEDAGGALALNSHNGDLSVSNTTDNGG